MNRLEKLKLKLAEKHYKESGHVPTDWALINFYSGFDAASAEYEKIIAELEEALIFYANGDGDVLDWDRVNNQACIQDRGKTAQEALQSIEKFLEGKE